MTKDEQKLLDALLDDGDTAFTDGEISWMDRIANSHRRLTPRERDVLHQLARKAGLET